MTDHDKKALRLVVEGRVTVESWRVEHDTIVFAKGTVLGDHGQYQTTAGYALDCDCVFGMNQPGRSHTHTRAMELAAWNLARKQTP